MENKEQLESYKRDYVNIVNDRTALSSNHFCSPTSNEGTQSPVNRLSAIILETTKPLESVRMRRIIVPSMEELEAKVTGKFYYPRTTPFSVTGEISVPKEDVVEVVREQFRSPSKHLCPVLIEVTQREENNLVNVNNNAGEIYRDYINNTKKQMKIEMNKSNNMIHNKENNKNYSKNVQRKNLKVAKKRRSKSTSKLINKGKFTQEETIRLWKLVQKHAKKCSLFAGDLKKEGFAL